MVNWLWVAVAMAGNPVELHEIAYRADVAGPLADVWVEQVFRNVSDEAVDATYVFPLHEQAAVDDMEILLGERVIASKIMRREAARAAFAEAKDQGRVAALTEAETASVFTQSVANIPAGSEVVVRLHMVQPVDRVDGEWQLTLPLVVMPRFSVGPGPAWNPPGDLPEIDDELVVSVDISVDSGLPLQDARVVSYRDVAMVERPRSMSALWSAKGAARDFVLAWRTAPETPEAAFLVQDGHAVVLFEPPRQASAVQRIPRELIFVVDQSGSMSSGALDVAKEAMVQALEGMDPRDSVQVMSFNHSVRSLTQRPVPATEQNVGRAVSFVRSLQAAGGTYLIDGVEAALAQPVRSDRTRIVVFLTDGGVSAEKSTLARIADLLGGAHVFAFGAGPWPNRALLTEMAHVGGGKVTWIREGEDNAAVASRFLETIDRPVLTDIEIDWGDWRARDVTPHTMPALFADQPMFVAARVGDGSGPITVRGRLGDRRYEAVLEPSHVGREEARALGVTWARQEIAALERQLMWGPVQEVEDEIVDVSLRYRVLSRFTAFVAVDDSVVLPSATVENRAVERRQVSHASSSSIQVMWAVSGGSNPNIGGSASNENSYLMDGATVTDPVTGTFGNNFNFIQVGSSAPPLLLGTAPEFALPPGHRGGTAPQPVRHPVPSAGVIRGG